MELWLETLGIILIAVLGVILGRAASRTSPRSAVFAMAASFSVIGLILLARLNTLWDSFPFLCPIAASRLRFLLLAFAVTLGLTAPLAQLKSIMVRWMICLLMGVFLGVLVGLPYVGPVMIRSELAATQTRMDTDGVCRQSQPFTCGPAAAVTALNQFGIHAAEGDLALRSRTSPVIGTSPWELYQTLKSGYADQGIECSFLHMNSIDQLPTDAILLAVVRDAPVSDHCVAVLGVNEKTITVADPMAGLIHIPRASFSRQWRNCGILMQRSI